ncbi:MAG: gliding motility-associated C-terminal domain-containing protein [Bacteroidota bacterium]
MNKRQNTINNNTNSYITTSGPSYIYHGNTTLQITDVGSNDGFLLDSTFKLCFSDTISNNAVAHEISIYNRWGVLVMQCCCLNDCWDGTSIDTKQYPASGVYFFNIIIYFSDKAPEKYLKRVYIINKDPKT